MIFHENCLPADDSHEISYLICFCFLKKYQNLKLSAANFGGALWVNVLREQGRLRQDLKNAGF